MWEMRGGLRVEESHREKFRDEPSFEHCRRLQSALPGFKQVTDASRNTGTFDSTVPLKKELNNCKSETLALLCSIKTEEIILYGGLWSRPNGNIQYK